jgi:hypothetical protein
VAASLLWMGSRGWGKTQGGKRERVDVRRGQIHGRRQIHRSRKK